MTGIKAHIGLTIILILTAVLGSSQPVEHVNSLKPRHLRKMVNISLMSGDTWSAIILSERLVELRPENIGYKHKLADLYKETRNYPKAAALYLEVYAADESRAECLYYAADMKKSMGKYTEALELFERFDKTRITNSETRNLRRMVKSAMEGCIIADKLRSNPLNLNAVRLDTSVNKPHIEFSPLPLNDSVLMYASYRADDIIYYRKEGEEKPTVRKFYVADKKDNNYYFRSEAPYPFNHPDYNVGNGSFSLDGERFYFTRCKTDKRGKNICNIYVSQFENGRWQEAEALPSPINIKDYTSTMPATGIEPRRKQEVLYFVSDRPQGRGGMDIWFTILDKRTGRYRAPRNLGGKINTLGDEITPFYDEDVQALYFSSTGWPGMGGLDVFKSSGNLTNWSKPENVGYPINSPADDLYFVFIKRKEFVDKDYEEGFLVSNRAGGENLLHATCCDDIFSLQWLEQIKVSVKGEISLIPSDSLFDFSDMFFTTDSKHDSQDKIFIDSALVSLYYLDDSGEEILLANDTTSGRGEYFFRLEIGKKYKIEVEKDGYIPKETTISTEKINRTDTLNVSLGLKKMPDKPFIIKNIYYPFDKTYLTQEAKLIIDTTLFKLLTDNPSLIVEISSHTDSRGSDNYNIRLSQGRAESVVIYLIQKGISADRLLAKGYGKHQPIAPNEHPDGSDNPEGRQMNRRTEFRVIGVLKRYSDIIYED